MSPSRAARRFAAHGLLAALTFAGWPAAANPFADPPGSGPDDPPPDEPPPFPHPAPPLDGRPSTVRVHVGPALRLDERATAGGLFAGIDLGRRATGLRLSGTWAADGRRDAAQQYAAELWVDFAAEERLRPILGAGAGVLRLQRTTDDGVRDGATEGVAVLRLALEYLIPLEDADARAALTAIGTLPAIQGRSELGSGPTATLVASVGVGF
ncbi:MAG: hypothetical protein IT376_22990 [Polyangiaceae bacterium]|nr:hypothetical protein [Polyangiaceae bacterium]